MSAIKYPELIELSDTQQSAYQQLLEGCERREKLVLYGQPGSGKTELCYQLLREELSKGKQVLLLMPEIALATEATRQIKAGMDANLVFEWHSGVGKATKRSIWKKIATGCPSITVGARSALFLPFQNLSLIAVEEEHDRSFKQDAGVLYHARDAAVMLAESHQCPLVLVSATPSLETVVKVQRGFYRLIKVAGVGKKTVPTTVHKIDMRDYQLPPGDWLSPPLRKGLVDNYQSGQQSLLFLNRRGYSPLTFCRNCGYRFVCQRCSACLVSHCNQHQHTSLVCHYCNFRQDLPDHCPECQQNDFCFWGPGCEKLAEEVSVLIPNCRTLILTSDKMKSVSAVKEKFSLILHNQIDVIIGTQVIAKGHNFPHLTLVGLVDADSGRQSGDLRSYERLYQLLAQVTGRTGRFHLPSQIYLQTYRPDDQFLNQIIERNLPGFLNTELQIRKSTGMPPYTQLAAIVLNAKKEADLRQTFHQLSLARPDNKEVEIWGPAPALIPRIKGQYRWRYLVKAPRDFPIQNFIQQWLTATNLATNYRVRFQIDIDPYNFS